MERSKAPATYWSCFSEVDLNDTVIELNVHV